MAAEVARVTGLPLRAVLARKVGAPGRPELAIGAVGPDGTAHFDDDLVHRLRDDSGWLVLAADAERAISPSAPRVSPACSSRASWRVEP